MLSSASYKGNALQCPPCSRVFFLNFTSMNVTTERGNLEGFVPRCGSRFYQRKSELKGRRLQNLLLTAWGKGVWDVIGSVTKVRSHSTDAGALNPSNNHSILQVVSMDQQQIRLEASSTRGEGFRRTTGSP